MKLTLSRSVKTLTMLFAFAAILGLGQSVARADEVFLSGSTRGCLCTTPGFIPQPFVSGGLTFTGSNFSGTTQGGGLTFSNFGTFQLSASANPADFNGQQFSLLVTFEVPRGIGGDPLPFSTLITGTVSANPSGFIIDFDNSPRTFAFTNPSGTGSFQLTINDTVVTSASGFAALAADATGAITGDITNATFTPNNPQPVPEPATVLLLATGLAGVVGAARRRRGPR